MLVIVNKREIDKWMFEHCQLLGHKAIGIKGKDYPKCDDLALSEVNVAYKDTTTDEILEILYMWV